MPDAEGKSDARGERLQGPMTLRHRDRNFVVKQLNAEAMEKCNETRLAYVECARGRTLSLSWACKGFFREFNECLHQYTTEEKIERRIAETAAQWKAANDAIKAHQASQS
mmetsp:Transcript_23411/g.62751  ORF Transcript_23411/g.62751 Transcript_23411/m.62751 type:complete len:110 (-) Transcript_23411:297-626(-)